MKKAKKFLCVVLTAFMLLSSVPMQVFSGIGFTGVFDFLTPKAGAEDPHSGTCGENLTWSFDTETGVLDITGAGSMNNYSTTYSSDTYITTAPWGTYISILKTVNISAGVTSIGSHAFYGCTGLTSITIPNSVTSIDDNAFDGCTGLTSITIPDSVTSIGMSAFALCTSLTSIAIPNSVKRIDYYAFFGCTGLTSLTLPENPISIGPAAFSNTSISSIEIPSSWTKIDDLSFLENEMLTSIKLPYGLTKIGEGAFANCYNLSSVTIPNTVTTIKDGAFNDCNNICDVYFYGTTEEWLAIDIGENNYCLTGANIHLIDRKCGQNISWYLDFSTGVLNINGTGEMYNYSGYDNSDYVLSPWNLFFDEIKAVYISDGVTSIGDYAFAGLTKLNSIELPSSVTKISESAFEECTGMNSISFSEGITNIYYNAFKNCTALADVFYSGSASAWNQIDIENGNDYLTQANIHYVGVFSGECGREENTVFWTLDTQTGELNITGEGEMNEFYSGAPWAAYASSIKTVNISNGITSIGREAFAHCDKLASITIPDSVTIIKSFAFWDCKELSSITIPDNVTVIEYDAFNDCTGLTSITIANSVTSIGNRTFSGCTGLTSFIIPDSVVNIGESAFYDTGYYNNKTNWTDGVLYVDNCLVEASKDISGKYTLAEGTKLIANAAFRGCENLTAVEMGNTVKSIGDLAFANCINLSSVIVSEEAKYIGGSAFIGCNNLQYISGLGKIDRINSDIFFECEKLKSLTIPNTVTTVCDYAFHGLHGLTELKLPNSVTEIGMYAFAGCTNMTSISLSENLTSIRYGTFLECSALTSIKIPTGVTEIYGLAFGGCSNLTSIELPDSLIHIDIEAFDYTGYFNNPDNWTNGVLYIGNHLIKNTNSSTSFVVPNGIKSIAGISFLACKDLTTIVIPDSVNGISVNAFLDCSMLTDVFYFGSEEEWNKVNIDRGNDYLTNATIHYNHVPTEKIEIKQETSQLKMLDSGNLGLASSLTREQLKALLPDNVEISTKPGINTPYTGMTVTLKDSMGKVVDTLTVVVKGDVNGDGKVSAADARLALRQSVGLEALKNENLEAAKVSDSKDVKAAQARLILRGAVGLETPEKLLG